MMAAAILRAIALVAATAVLSAAARPPASAGQTGGPLVLETYFAGRTLGTGVFESWIAGVHRPFEIIAEGSWDGEVLTLVEDFRFADGETDRKTWRFVRTGDGEYSGTREDVVGEAVVTTEDGRIRMAYDLDLPRDDGSTIRLHFRDVLERRDDGSVLNTARVTKFGFPIARVEVVFDKPSP